MLCMKELLHKIADRVEIVVKKGWCSDRGKKVRMGADGTPTSYIDEIAENAILEMIKEENIDINILSEECGFVDNHAERTLVVDPIDGTHNAVRNIPFYSVSLAVGADRISNVKYALVRNLASGDTFYAEKDKGAFLNNRPIYTKKFDIHKSLFSVYLGSIASPKSFEIAKKPRRVRSLGAASLDMCSVASGSSDLYYINVLKNVKDSRLRVVDIAAGTLIVREAGGEVFNLNEELLDLEFNLRNRSNIIVVGDKKVLEVIR